MAREAGIETQGGRGQVEDAARGHNDHDRERNETPKPERRRISLPQRGERVDALGPSCGR